MNTPAMEMLDMLLSKQRHRPFPERRMLKLVLLTLVMSTFASGPVGAYADEDLRKEALLAMRKASEVYRRHLASHGGYVYYYSLANGQRWGEGRATKDQIWIQPPGTPTVGLAYVRAYKATGDRFYQDAATLAALAVAYGQLKSGGWTNCVDFDPQGTRTAAYRNGRGRGKDNSSLDDGQTQSAIRLLIHVDRTWNFKNRAVAEAARSSLDALLKAQFPNGGFPQVWTGPVKRQPRLKASYPNYDWRTEGRIKNYWDMYTLNDNVCGYVAETLIDAHKIYGGERYHNALRRLGEFLQAAQMPEPQPGWAQQYNYEMKPIWARKFEPPAVSGDETQEVIETLLTIVEATGDEKYLEPIPRALAYLERSLLADGRLARYYELRTNKPLYMKRNGKQYTLTYDDSRLPAHYGWKWESRIDELKRRYQQARAGKRPPPKPVDDATVRAILNQFDEQGRWISTYNGERLVGQPKMKVGEKYVSSAVFARNLETLARYASQP